MNSSALPNEPIKIFRNASIGTAVKGDYVPQSHVEILHVTGPNSSSFHSFTIHLTTVKSSVLQSKIKLKLVYKIAV